ncbi:hypothetical protein [Nonomuraea rhizosphaerae]|uniref:hypothetical protein n=1 Tax=Nonomuraea rhizosphaerae TaxID=2665663 RepID=UPI001C5CF5AF|nr:hypothetical protein [Nonomuraea rhizosphaerae]
MTRRWTPRRSVIRLTTARNATATHHRYPYRSPVLALDCGATTVLLTCDGPVTSGDLAFAHQLAREAARYARSVESRFYGRDDTPEAAA